MTIVLDSWAVMRLLEGGNPAAQTVADLLETERPLMSWMNLGEVAYVLERNVGTDEAAETVRDLRRVVDACLADEALTLAAAHLKATYPMAFADAFGAALAMRNQAELWTGDPELLVPNSPWSWRDLRV